MVDQDRKYFDRRRGALDKERSGWIDHWRELTDYLSPRTSEFLSQDRSTRGAKKNQKIIDATGTFANGMLSAGLMGGGTSPARPWFQLRVDDPALNEFQPVKEWLEHVRKRMVEVFIRSNLYTVLPSVYSDLGSHGTSAFAVLEDEESVIRCYHAPIGSYMLGTSDRGIVDSYYREYEMTIAQLVQRFSLPECSESVQSAYKLGNLDQLHKVVHAVEPNLEANSRRLDSRFKPWVSVYYEAGDSTGRFLSRRGFDALPVIAPRWSVTGECVYGDSPGMLALGDIKQLQTMHRRKLQFIEMAMRPPLDAPVELKRKKISLLPSDITFTSRSTPQAMVQPIHVPNLNQQHILMEIQDVQQRIDKTFYKDLFLMFSQIERSGITATEIAARQEEKLLALGPVYLRLNDELLDRLIERAFGIMTKRGMFAPPPDELQGRAINVEYISVMAQTMKSIGIANIERSLAFAGSLAEAFPTVLDNINPDATITEYFGMAGAPPALLFDPKVRDEGRRVRAQKQAMVEGLAAAQQGAQTAQTLSQTQLGNSNALSQIMQRMAPQQGQEVPA